MNKNADWNLEIDKRDLKRSFLMKALTAVAAIHVVGLGAFLMVQGCANNGSQNRWGDVNTMPSGQIAPPPTPNMPPAPIVDTMPEAKPTPIRSVPPKKYTPKAPVKTYPSYPKATGTYKVRKGDTLSEIASRYGISWSTLAGMNGIDDPRKLRVGQTLSVPGTAKSSPAPSSAPKAAVTGGTYKVNSGDTLSGIAARNKIKVADLKSANGLSSDRISVGQKLIIPGVKNPATRAKEAPKPRTATPAKKSTSTSSAPAPAAPAAPAPAAPVAPTPVAPAPVAPAAPEVAPAAPVAPATTNAPAPANSVEFTSVTVFQGDTLDSYASQYYTTVEKLREINDLPADAELRAGQTIYVPRSN